MKPYYEADGITIYHADCREVLPTLEPLSVDLVLTDPPYGMAMDTDYASRFRGTAEWRKLKGDYRGKAYRRVEGDDTSFDPTPLLRFPRLILFGADHYADKLPASRGWIVWDKREELGSNMLSDAELAWTNIKTPTRIFRHKWLGYMRASEVGKHYHPTQKPVALMTWLVERFTKPGDLVLDPYMGSGPIAKACQITGRRYIGMDVHLPYVEIAATRLQQAVLPLGIAD